MDELRVRISSDSAKLLFSFLAPTPRWQFDGEVWTLTASETVPTLSEQGTVRILGERFVDEHGRMRAGWWRVSSVGVRSSKDRRSGPTRLPSASRITVAPGHCVRSRQSGQQSALRPSEFGFLPVSVDRRTQGCHLLRAVCIGRKGDLRAFSSLAAGSYRLTTRRCLWSLRAAALVSYAPFPRAPQDNAI